MTFLTLTNISLRAKFLIIVLILPMFNVRATEDGPKFVSGITKASYEDPNPPLFYNSYVAMLTRYDLPNFSSDSYTYTCNQGYSRCNYNNTKLPITLLNYQQLMSPTGVFSDAFPPWGELPLKSSDYAYAAIEDSILGGILETSSCDEIKPSFSKLNYTESEIERYLLRLDECANDKYTDAKYDDFHITKFPSSKTVFTQMGNEMGTSLHVTSEYGTFLLARANVDSLYLTNHLFESQKWREAFRDCRAARIPSSIMSAEDFVQRLTSISNNIKTKKQTYKLAIPATRYRNTNSYYRLPLTDCTFTGKNSFLTRILIPIIEDDEAEYELFRLKPIPFLKTHNSTQMQCFVESIVENKVYLMDKRQGFFTESDCKPGELCKVPNYRGNWGLNTDLCVGAFLKNWEEGIQLHCLLKCSPVMENSAAPIFRAVSSDTVVMMGGNNRSDEGTIFVKCNHNPHSVVKPVETGTVQLTLPCGCQVIYKSVEIFRSVSPCGQFLWRSHIQPFAWRNADTDNTNPFYYAGKDATTTAAPESEDLQVPMKYECSCSTSILMYIHSIVILITMVVLGWLIYGFIQLKKLKEHSNLHVSYNNFEGTLPGN